MTTYKLFVFEFCPSGIRRKVFANPLTYGASILWKWKEKDGSFGGSAVAKTEEEAESLIRESCKDLKPGERISK